MAIKYTHPETGESTHKEPWAWQAVYNDNSKLDQFEFEHGGSPTFHRFAEIDIENIKALRLVHASLPAITVPIPPGAKPVHHYINSVLENEAIRIRYYVIGYEHKNTKHFVLVTDKNNVYMVDNPHSIQPVVAADGQISEQLIEVEKDN